MASTADWRPWNRFRLARHGEAPTEVVALRGVTVDSFRDWAFHQGLTQEAAEAGIVAADGGHRLGSVWAYCVVTGQPATVAAMEVAVTAAHPDAPPELATFLLQPVAPALEEAQRAALDTWLRDRVVHGSPYNAVTTLGGVQLSIAIDDAHPLGRTWDLTTRPA